MDLEEAFSLRDVEKIRLYRDAMPAGTFRLAVIDKLSETDDADLLGFLLENNFSISPYDLRKVLKRNALRVTRYTMNIGLYTRRFIRSAVKTSLEMTKLVLPRFREYDVKMMCIIPYSRDVEIAKYLVEDMDLGVSGNDIFGAINMNRVDLLPYLFRKCDDMERYFYSALYNAIINHIQEDGLALVEYLISLGAKCTPQDIGLAAQEGHLDLVMFFHQKGYEIDDNTSSRFGDVDNYLHEHRLGVYKECLPHCIRCYEMNERIIINTWYMETTEYNSLHQWLPQEIIDDVLELCMAN